MQTGLIDEIIRNYNSIKKEMSKVVKPSTSSANMRRGFEVSGQACSQPAEVAMTPIMKNMLKRFGDLKEGQRLLVNSPKTKAEIWLDTTCRTILTKYNNEGKSLEYDHSQALDSKQFYDVDCWDNLKDNMRDIQPGQRQERLDVSKVYGTRTKPISMLDMLRKDKVFQKAVEIVCEQLPSVRASHEFKMVNLPFMTKHTNVSFPYWMNDKSIVTVGKYKGLTYAQATLKEAEVLPIESIYQYNISTAYGRNQRGKGRLLIAISRIPNLILNQLESVEIDAYKRKSPLFAGYNDAPYLKDVMVSIINDCKSKGWVCANWDQRRYDQTVSEEWLILLGAISMVKANGQRSKELALKRAALMTRTWLVNGMTGKLEEIYGRIFSGFIDTNRGGGIINAIKTTYCLMKQDPEYSDIAYTLKHYMLVMGDDNLFVYNPDHFDADKFVKDMASIGSVVHPEKRQYGGFFLQNRVFKNEEKEIMVYPWTRVLRSALFKETGKGLGPYGWVLAIWQQLYKLIEFPMAFKIVLNILCEFDDLQCGYGKSVEYILGQVRAEDAAALGENKRSKSTAETLYDGDPTKDKQFSDNGGAFNSEYLSQIQKAVNDNYDPQFLRSIGIKIPSKRSHGNM